MVVIHCSATPPSMDIGAKEIRKWHVEDNGWRDIGYHLVIRRNGIAEGGRPLHVTPAAQRGYNKGSIAICLVGGVDQDNSPEDNFTLEQFEMLRTELLWLRDEYDIVSIVGHSDLANKDCPCFNVTDWVYHNLVRD